MDSVYKIKPSKLYTIYTVLVDSFLYDSIYQCLIYYRYKSDGYKLLCIVCSTFKQGSWIRSVRSVPLNYIIATQYSLRASFMIACINILLITGKANGYYFLYIVYSLFKQMSTGCVIQTKCICVVCANNTTEKACIIQSTLVTTCMITMSLVCRG